MKITVKEAKIYTTDDFKAAAEEERFKNRAEIWADQFNRHAEYIGLKDRARVEKDLHGCDSVVWDYGYIVAKDPFGDKWQVRFGDNAYTLEKTKVTPYLYRQMDSMIGFKGESREYPVNLYITTRYDDADAAEQFLKDMGGEDVTVSKSRNGDGLYVSVEGDGVDAFLDVYKERFDDIVKSCDANANGWTDPVDLKYYK